ncbi:hypothetical protein [Flavobacterium lacus]|uniref:hypothetical protein n=1 Tax=Flavobacterium lacus TaxID=1353778 RepID=UPI000DD3192C|nr:hypothetical protein [Flavobacterium lacus]
MILLRCCGIFVIFIQNYFPQSRETFAERATKSHIRNKNFQFWQLGNHAEEIYSEKFMWSKIDYIHLNPVRAGLVEKAAHYLYSSASNYVYNEGIIKIELVDIPLNSKLNLNSFMKDISCD